MSDYAFIADLLATVPEIPDGAIISRTIHSDADVKAVVFGFAAGQELSEHTASMPASLVFLTGEATLTVGEDTHSAQAGTWVHMPPHQSHSIVARTPVVMLLLFRAGT